MPTDPPHLRPLEVDSRELLRQYARWKQWRRESVFCLQVGANDGITNDPVNRFLQHGGWSGLLVEPLVDVFADELSVTYAGNPRVILENVALAPMAGTLPFYRVSVSRARWATGLSTFRRETIEKHIENGYIATKARVEGIEVPSDPAELIEELQVECMTVEKLLAKHAVESFQVLCIDTEGFDFEILKLVDLARYRPEFLLFESKNLSDADHTQALSRLRGLGYTLFWDNGDTVATTMPYTLLVRIGAALERTARNRLGPVRRWLRAR